MATRVEGSAGRARRARSRAAWGVATVVLVAAAGAALVGRVAPGEDGQAARPDLERILDGLVAGPDRLAPGVSAYVSGPHGTWVGSAGVANVSTGEPMQPGARVRLESVSKIWTAALVLQLAQERLLQVDDTVERWLPGLLPYGDEITIRQLLTMRSGLIDNNDLVRKPAAYLARVRDDRLRAQLTRIAERVSANPALEVSPTWWIRFAAWQPLLFPPGSQVHYSNIGYDLLGLIAVRAAGEPLPRLFHDRFFAPLDLHATAYDPQGPIRGPHARGYALAGDGRLTETSDQHFGVGADGGIVSDATDTAVFLTALMRGELLDPGQVAAMKGESLWLGGATSGCAGPAYGWSGGGSGYKTNVWVDGNGTRVAVLLLNARLVGDRQLYGDATAAAALARLYCAA